MVKYLQMDGIDDNLYTPTITFNEVIMEFEAPYASDRYILDTRTGGNAYVAWTSTVNKMQCFNTQYYVDGVNRITENMGIGSNQRVELRLVLNATTTDDVRIFSANTNFNRAAGKIWFIKFLNAGTVVAHYDMNTGAVNDISGNNRHATLIGGTWVEDGGGGTGTPGTTTANTKQVVYAPKTMSTDTKQMIYAPRQANIDLKQAVYKNGLIIADMLQMIQGNNVSIVNMRQVVYKQGQVATNTKQDIYKPGQVAFNMKQAVYKTGIAYANLLQLIQSINSVTIETKQVIYKQAMADLNTLQRIYESGTNDVDLLVRVLENYKVYENVFEMIFEINTKIETEFSIEKEIETEFKIIQELNKAFKI